jgi:hypothetical protein
MVLPFSFLIRTQDALAHAGITPGNTYTLDDIRSPLESAFGATPIVNCGIEDGRKSLTQLTLCIGKDLKVCTIRCPSCFYISIFFQNNSFLSLCFQLQRR